MPTALRTSIAQLRDADLTCVSPDELLVETEELLDARNQLDAAIAARLAQADRAEATIDVCGRTTRSWLHEELRVSRPDASLWCRTARALALHPTLAQAFTAGRISLEHVRVILRCLHRLHTDQRTSAEEILVEAARHCSPDDLTPVFDALLTACGDETAEEREARKYDARWCDATTTFDGMVRLEAMLDPESGRTVLSGLEPLMATAPAEDPRTTGQRRADALTDLARIAMAHAALPDHNGDRPQLVVTLDYDTLLAELTDPDRPAATLNLLDSTVTVTPETARRLACDADIIPAVLDGDRRILDLGRQTPTWTVHQRRAAALRDRHCTYPDCRAGLDRCQLHHLHHWSRGGPTNLSNSAHLCHFHHWLVHHRNWTIWRHPITHHIKVTRTRELTSAVRRT